jgi:glycosyltransferase involved in cell wall biosynthesis
MLHKDARVVYCVEGGAAATFSRAHLYGCRRLLEGTLHPDYAVNALAKEYENLGLRYTASIVYPRGRLMSEIESCDGLITQSEFAANTYRANGIPAAKLHIVPLGVDLDTFRPADTPVPRKRRQPVRLLFVGQLSVRKGVARLLDVLDQLSKESVEVTLIGMLDADLRPTFERMRAASSHKINWIPGMSRRELVAYYQAADLFVLPSLCDSFGQVILEAMACGTPALVTDTCGAPVRDGLDGWVVPVGNTEALAQKLMVAVQLGSQGLAKLGSNAADQASRYSWRAFRVRMAQLISQSCRLDPIKSLD